MEDAISTMDSIAESFGLYTRPRGTIVASSRRSFTDSVKAISRGPRRQAHYAGPQLRPSSRVGACSQRWRAQKGDY